MDEIVELHEENDFVIFIDDAHKIPKELHEDIAENLKEAYDRELKICVGYIHYRGDDLTKADMDLAARVGTIELSHWAEKDLKKIGEIGFEKLNVNIDENVIKNFAKESLGSPHLMQKLCYRLCVENDIFVRQNERETLEISDEEIIEVLNKIANNLSSSYSTEFEHLSGSIHGREGKSFDFIDGTEGDRYTAFLRGIVRNKPKMSFDLEELKSRIRKECDGKSPQSGNITQDIQRIDGWISDSDRVEDFVFEYMDERKQIEIPEPPLVFYLRWSDNLDYQPSLQV